jgi:simple sugar transport system permease protein
LERILETILTAQFGFMILRVTTPILFAALAALISIQVGVINVGLEGMMLMGALTGVIISAFTGSALLGFILSLVVGIISGLILAYLCIKMELAAILAGLVMNMLGSGGTIFVLHLLSGDKGISSSLESKILPNIKLPFISKIPIVGEILSGHHVLTYVSILSVVLIYYLIYKTKLGIRIRAVGQNPQAAKTAGINVTRVQYIALAISGLLASLGGVFLSMGYVSWFSQNMSAGRGFIGLAAQTMGMSTPLGTFLASLVFGIASALSNVLTINIPPQFIQMIPYVATIVGLVIYSRKSKQQLL